MLKPERSDKRLKTVVAIKTLPSRPYKIYVEVRRTDDGRYALTVVSRDEEKMLNISRALSKRGYRHRVYRDAYGFTRVHVRNLGYGALSYIVVMLRYWAKESESEKERAVA